MPPATYLKIGQVSKQTGVAVGALRYYESLGLLQSERGENGYRYYPQVSVQQVRFIKKAQTLGFSLDDIAEVINIHQQGDTPCEFVRSRLQAKIEQLETQIQAMIAFKTDLEHYRDRWSTTQPRLQTGDICPLIDAVPINSIRDAPSR